MSKKLLSVLLLSAALALPGCCGFARAFCPVSQATGPARLQRDSADEAVDYLVDAFRRRSVADIYQSLHPEFRAQYGSFSQAEFTSAFDPPGSEVAHYRVFGRSECFGTSFP